MKFQLPITLLLAVTSGAVAQEASEYAGQESRQIKALSEQAINDYLAGRGMGLAKAAELNGYPGPKHVMELGEKLQLTDEQRQQTADLFDAMQAEAVRIGEEIVVKETALDTLFARQSISPEALSQLTAEIAILQGQLRTVHLGAHLAQYRILTSEQREHYAGLRGYHKH